MLEVAVVEVYDFATFATRELLLPSSSAAAERLKEICAAPTRSLKRGFRRSAMKSVLGQEQSLHAVPRLATSPVNLKSKQGRKG